MTVDWGAVIAAVILVTPPTLLGIRNNRKLKIVNRAVNSRPVDTPTVSDDISKIAQWFDEPKPGDNHMSIPSRLTSIETTLKSHMDHDDHRFGVVHQRIDTHLDRK